MRSEATLKRHIAATQEALRSLTAELEAASNPYGPDAFPNDTVLRFKLRYDTNAYSKWYSFAVIKTNGLWYPTGTLGTTGRSAKSWESLCRIWSTYYVKPESIDVMTQTYRLALP